MNVCQFIRGGGCSLSNNYLAQKIVLAKDFVHHSPDTMDVFIADLNEDRAGIAEEIARDGETVTKIGEIAVNTVTPRVAKGFHLLWFACYVCSIAIFDVAARRAPLKVAV